MLQEGFTRDTERFAIKASYAENAAGDKINIQKKPKTDVSKASKAGLLKVVLRDKDIVTVSQNEPGQDLLQTVYEDGMLSPVNGNEIINRTLF